MDFQKNRSNGIRVSAKKVLHLNALIYWPIVTKLALFVAHMWRGGCVDFQENSSNGS
jgi:hypothetical protein